MDWEKTIKFITDIVIALAAVGLTPVLTIKSWRKATDAAREQAKAAAILNTNYSIYKDILQNINEILAKNSTFITNLNQHTSRVANILNEWHGQAGYAAASLTRQKELREEWAVPSKEVVENAYELQIKALELTRLLDMSGADFGAESKIYNSLWFMYHELNNKVSGLVSKWTKLDLDTTSIQQYQWLLDETKQATELATEFAQCVEDVLKLVYNKLVAIPMDKTLKGIDLENRKRIITEDGLRDTRIKDAT